MQSNRNAQYGITLLRVMVGIIFVMHGGMKLFGMGFEGVAGFFGSLGIPFPYANAVFVTLLEVVGGAMLVAGLFTRWVSPLLAVTMVVAIATVHGPKGFFLPDGYEFALLLLVTNATLFLTGSGALALDNLIGRAWPQAPAASSPKRVAQAA
jgi:putative oxidoreductase